MRPWSSRFAGLLIGSLVLALTVVPVAADELSDDQDVGWGRQAVDQCRSDDQAEQFDTFGQCVSSQVHQLNGTDQDDTNHHDQDDQHDQHDGSGSQGPSQGHGPGQNPHGGNPHPDGPPGHGPQGQNPHGKP